MIDKRYVVRDIVTDRFTIRGKLWKGNAMMVDARLKLQIKSRFIIISENIVSSGLYERASINICDIAIIVFSFISIYLKKKKKKIESLVFWRIANDFHRCDF